MSFIHDARYFTKDEILRRAEKYEFPNPLAVELFLWDCELAAQIQAISEDIVLKGGAAVQLYLPLEKQRGSVDIDIATPTKKSGIVETIQRVNESLKGTAQFKLHKPRNPIPKLPLVTYFATTPSKAITKKDKLEIKIDFLCEYPKLPSQILNDVQTYAVHVKRMKCSTAGTLIGDKLLTLAKESIGMHLEADYPKQIYDIDALLQSHISSNSLVSNMLTSVRVLSKLEASYRGINITPIDALYDVIRTMNGYSQVDTSGGDKQIKMNIEGFQQFLVNKNQRKPYYEWSSKSLRIRFLSILLIKAIQTKLTEKDVFKTIIKCRNIANELKKISGNAVGKLKERILGLAQLKIPYFKELKGKPLDRIFWQIVTLENLQEIEKEIESI